MPSPLPPVTSVSRNAQLVALGLFPYATRNQVTFGKKFKMNPTAAAGLEELVEGRLVKRNLYKGGASNYTGTTELRDLMAEWSPMKREESFNIDAG